MTSRPTGLLREAPITETSSGSGKTADDFGTFGSLIVATPEVVYVKDGSGVLCLDAETGAELNRFSLSTDPQIECRWLTLQDGVLVSVLGQRPQVTIAPRAFLMSDKDHGDPEWATAYFGVHQNWFQEYDRGTELVALDAASGKELWRRAAKGIDPAKTAIAAAASSSMRIGPMPRV